MIWLTNRITGASLASLIETRRRTIETLELEGRIARLEQGKEPGR